jgi:hypothetical protein
MGETHPMSFNDLISTGIGGAAMGETMYRFSSMLLDNEATGSGRFWREAGAFVTDPIRGLNRLVSGRAWKVAPNPSDPIDTDPPGQANILSLGWREMGNGKYPSLTHDTSTYSFLQYLHAHGDVFDNDRRGPWDYFIFEAEGYSGERTKLGKLFMRGNWLTTRVGEADPMQHAAAIVQHFDYINTNAYEYGGQSIGGALFSRWGKAGPLDFRTRFDIAGTLMGAVNSDYSDLAQVADQERIREYDYGPGALGSVTMSFGYRGKPIFSASYRLDFLYVTNGSIYHGGDPEVGDEIGLDARHWLHGADLRFDTPTWKNFGLGAQYTSFTRESHYKITFPEDPELAEYSITQLKKQTNPELKVFVTYYPGGE